MDWSSCTNDGTANGIPTIKCIEVALHNLIGAAFLFAGSAAAIVIILGGIKYIQSRGDPKNVQGAQQTLTFGLIGLLIVLFAFGIVTFITFLTGTSKSCILNGFGTC